jgi:uncharacterized protein YdeI (BOF family)
MKRVIGIAITLGLFLVLAAMVSALGVQNAPQSSNAWYWETTHTVQEAWNANEEVVVVEGEIGDPVEPVAWNRYEFGDGSEFVLLVNFGDDVPAEAIPKNTTVRIVGEVENAEIDVQGLETMGALALQPSATASGINSGSFLDQHVSLKGMIGNQQSGPPDYWNYYDFKDSTGTTTADLPDQDEFPRHLIPQGRTSMIYGQAKNGNGHRVDSELILLANFGDTPPPTNTPTATATLLPGVTPSPTNTPVPGGDSKIYLPVILAPDEEGPEPTPTATSQPPSDWVWEVTNTVSQINGRCCDDEVVIVEGEIGDKITGDGIPASWNYYEFSDGTGTIPLDFEDEVPAAAIPQNVTVRVLGEPGENNNIHKIEVDALQTLGGMSVGTNATAVGINSGSFEEQEVALIGRFGKLTEEWYLWFDFTDSTGTTTADIGNNDISPSQIPKDRDVWIFGEGGQDFGWNKVDTDYFLIAKSYN